MLLRRSLSSAPLTVGIRREDPERIWERRAPLTPAGVAALVGDGVAVEIEGCDRRVFRDAEYTAAGARLVGTLDKAHVVLGIKEPRVSAVLTSGVRAPYWGRRGCEAVARTYMMFSHTAKGQPYNTPLLAQFVVPANTPGAALRPRLIDYELLTDARGKRTVGFGWFAGVAGVLEALSSMAQSHLEHGIATPFLATPRPHTHPSLQSIRAALGAVGAHVTQSGVPAALGPFVIGLTGNGNVAHGCLDILRELPIEKVQIADLHALVTNPFTPLNKIYLAHALPQHYLTRADSPGYTRSDYYAHPTAYRSTFSQTIAPYLTLLLNGTGWSAPFPRLMTHPDLALALARARTLALPGHQFRCTNIADISCDIHGGIEFLHRSTTLSEPFYKLRVPVPVPEPKGEQREETKDVQIMAVDILPTTLPLDASTQFEADLLPYVRGVVRGYLAGPGKAAREEQDQVQDALERATIARGGALVGSYAGVLQAGVERYWAGAPEVVRGSQSQTESQKQREPGAGAGERKKRILLLGSGMVARPAVQVLTARNDVQLVIAGNARAELDALERDFSDVGAGTGVRTRLVDVEDAHDTGVLAGLIRDADVVISLLPATHHPPIATHCLTHHTHLITASYLTPPMRTLDTRARAADVLLLNELGLDPGIDHVSAVDLVARVHARGEVVHSFASFCGGVPASEVARGVPGGFKFSWSPRGVLLAGLNGARFLVDREVHDIAPGTLFQNVFHDVPVPIPSACTFEGLANRDSTVYQDAYGLPNPRTFIRGTLRYPGFSSLMESFRLLGLFDTTQLIYPRSWRAFVPLCVARQLQLQGGLGPATTTTTDAPALPKDAIARLVPDEHVPALLAALEWLGLSPPSAYAPAPSTFPPLPTHPTHALTLLTSLLAHKLAYAPGEHDMVVLAHEIIARDPTTLRERVYTSTLVLRGGGGGDGGGGGGGASGKRPPATATAMARAVGVPVAVAALLVLDGEVRVRGVCVPVGAGVGVGVVGPLGRRLERYGLGMRESVRDLGAGERTGTVEGVVRRAVGRVPG